MCASEPPEAKACFSLVIRAFASSGLLNHRYFSNQSGSAVKSISMTLFRPDTQSGRSWGLSVRAVAFDDLGTTAIRTYLAEEYARAHPARAIRGGRDTWIATNLPEP